MFKLFGKTWTCELTLEGAPIDFGRCVFVVLLGRAGEDMRVWPWRDRNAQGHTTGTYAEGSEQLLEIRQGPGGTL